MGIVVAVPDDQLGRVIAAICAREGVAEPGNRAAGAELVAAVCLRWLTDATVEHEARVAVEALRENPADALRQAERAAREVVTRARDAVEVAPPLVETPAAPGGRVGT